MQCEKDCWKCELEGCPYITLEEFKRQNEFDREENKARIPEVPKHNNYIKQRERARRYRQTEKYKKYNREYANKYQKAHPEYGREYKRIYNKNNKEHVDKVKRQWLEANRDKVRVYSALYGWKKRFEIKNGREPNEEEIYLWEVRYNKRRKDA